MEIVVDKTWYNKGSGIAHIGIDFLSFVFFFCYIQIYMIRIPPDVSKANVFNRILQIFIEKYSTKYGLHIRYLKC